MRRGGVSDKTKLNRIKRLVWVYIIRTYIHFKTLFLILEWDPIILNHIRTQDVQVQHPSKNIRHTNTTTQHELPTNTHRHTDGTTYPTQIWHTYGRWIWMGRCKSRIFRRNTRNLCEKNTPYASWFWLLFLQITRISTKHPRFPANAPKKIPPIGRLFCGISMRWDDKSSHRNPIL